MSRPAVRALRRRNGTRLHISTRKGSLNVAASVSPRSPFRIALGRRRAAAGPVTIARSSQAGRTMRRRQNSVAACAVTGWRDLRARATGALATSVRTGVQPTESEAHPRHIDAGSNAMFTLPDIGLVPPVHTRYARFRLTPAVRDPPGREQLGAHPNSRPPRSRAASRLPPVALGSPPGTREYWWVGP